MFYNYSCIELWKYVYIYTHTPFYTLNLGYHFFQSHLLDTKSPSKTLTASKTCPILENKFWEIVGNASKYVRQRQITTLNIVESFKSFNIGGQSSTIFSDIICARVKTP